MWNKHFLFTGQSLGYNTSPHSYVCLIQRNEGDYLNYQYLMKVHYPGLSLSLARPFSLQSFLNWKSKSLSIEYLEITTEQLGSTSFFHRYWDCMYHISQHSAVYIYTHLQAKAIYQFTHKKRAIQKKAPSWPQTPLADLHLLPLVPSTLARHWYLGIALDILLLSGQSFTQLLTEIALTGEK